jgi:excisionase family DNA binding protein
MTGEALEAVAQSRGVRLTVASAREDSAQEIDVTLHRAEQIIADLTGQLSALGSAIQMAPENSPEQGAQVPILMLTPEQAAEALAISRTQVFVLIRDNKLHSVKIGSSRRIPKGALDEYIAALDGCEEAG